MVETARARGQTPTQLAATLLYADYEQRLRCFIGLADLHTQWLAARYRPHAVQQLVHQATGDQGRVSPEQARKAAVELLHFNLEVSDLAGLALPGLHPADAAIERDVLAPLRAAALAQQKPQDHTPTPNPTRATADAPRPTDAPASAPTLRDETHAGEVT